MEKSPPLQRPDSGIVMLIPRSLRKLSLGHYQVMRSELKIQISVKKPFSKDAKSHWRPHQKHSSL